MRIGKRGQGACWDDFGRYGSLQWKVQHLCRMVVREKGLIGGRCQWLAIDGVGLAKFREWSRREWRSE